MGRMFTVDKTKWFLVGVNNSAERYLTHRKPKHNRYTDMMSRASHQRANRLHAYKGSDMRLLRSNLSTHVAWFIVGFAILRFLFCWIKPSVLEPHQVPNHC